MKQQELYRYYSTQRPVDLGTYPKEPDNPLVGFLNYDDRISVEHGAYRAWGEVTYRAPLTTDQLIQYELQPSRDNPDVRETMKEQAQAVGQWEERNHIPFDRRLTQCIGIGVYTCKVRVTPAQLAERHRIAVDLPLVPRFRPKIKKPQQIEERQEDRLWILSMRAQPGLKKWRF